MKGVARISFQGGALLVPARTRYDHEIAFEHATSYARRHGTARLDLDRKQFTINSVSDGARRLCAVCAHPLDTLTYALGGRELCLYCARRNAI
jgi:hypothetical protein